MSEQVKSLTVKGLIDALGKYDGNLPVLVVSTQELYKKHPIQKLTEELEFPRLVLEV